MSRVALFLMTSFYLPFALAHPGHDAPGLHLHAIWEVVLLVAAMAVYVVFLIRRTSSSRRERKHSRLHL